MNLIRTIVASGFLILTLSGILSSCKKKDKILSDGSAKIDFSTDTITFDTVFTSIGSTTKNFRIYNNKNQTIRISRISLGKGNQSPFRFNIDGYPGPVVTDVEIPPKDSLWVFVEVTIDPNNLNNPLLVRDSLIFEINGNRQDIKLVAVGQDVHFINSEIIGTQNWINDKPYLIYNSMLVDSLATLTINEGVKVYCNPNTRIFCAGTMVINGSESNPVIIQGDRLEFDYKEAAGQWVGMYFLAGSKDNVIKNAIIKNAILGIQVDTVFNSNYSLQLLNTEIKNMTYAGLYFQGAKILAENCIVANCGEFLSALTIGGNYEFTHCTFANYYSNSTRNTPSVLMNNYYKDLAGNIILRPIDKADFKNCIIYGSIEEEIGFDKSDDIALNYSFNNCLLKSVQNLEGNNNIRNSDPAFANTDPEENNFNILENSAARNIGNPNFLNFNTQSDIRGTLRPSPPTPPDVGAIQYKP